MRRHALARAPDECCGALLEGAEVRAFALANSADEPSLGYAINARSYLEAEAEADATGSTLIGFYHSHPHGPCEPSGVDIANAVGGFYYVIIGEGDALSTWYSPASSQLVRVTSP